MSKEEREYDRESYDDAGSYDGRRMPIVFCLDISPSMGWSTGGNKPSIELLNKAVRDFIAELKKEPKARNAAEIAFVAFSSNIEKDTEFESVATISPPVFATVKVGGTRMAAAVNRSIEKIEMRRKELINTETGFYAPFLVLVTDGNPDENDDLALQTKAMALVKSHCDSHVGAEEIIVPFIIGVGEKVNANTLTKYSAGFVNGFFHISDSQKGTQFRKVFEFIGNSTKKSIHLNGSVEKIVKPIKRGMNDLLTELATT